jgi:hypothetical protein
VPAHQWAVALQAALLAVLGVPPAVAPLAVQVGLLVVLGALPVVAPLAAQVAALVVGLLVVLAEVLVSLLGEFAVGLVEGLPKGFLLQGQILAFQRAQVQPAKQQADLELLVQSQSLQPGRLRFLVQFDDLHCQLANLEFLPLHQSSRMEQLLYGFVVWTSWQW